MKSICVFCGSNNGAHPEYAEIARSLGKELACRKIRLIYGGGHVGLMGTIADTALAHSGHVTGVIPQSLLDREVGHRGLTELRVVTTMHERKAMMSELADGFIAMPGGIGTLEELFEIWTWAQLGIHRKPIGLLNVLSYYDSLLDFISQSVEKRFVPSSNLEMILIDTNPKNLLDRMQNHQAPMVEKWLKSSET